MQRQRRLGLLGLLPLFGILLVAAILGPIMLGGGNFTFKAITPKASRMNPLSGLARMFGPKALMELLKAIAKVTGVGAVGALVLLVPWLMAWPLYQVKKGGSLAVLAVLAPPLVSGISAQPTPAAPHSMAL